MDYLQALEKFPSWFFYTLILTPGIFYLQYVEGTNLLDYSGFLIFILLIKSFFFGFLFVVLSLIDINIKLIKENKIPPELAGGFWKTLKSSKFDLIVLGAILYFLIIWGIYSVVLFIVPSYFYLNSSVFLFWVIYFFWLLVSFMFLDFHTRTKR